MDMVSIYCAPLNDLSFFITILFTSQTALKLHLETLTSEKLFKAIHAVIHDPKYRREAK